VKEVVAADLQKILGVKKNRRAHEIMVKHKLHILNKGKR